MSALTPLMHDALDAARRAPLRRVFDDQPGKPPWPAPPASLAALTRRGLLAKTERLSRQEFRIVEWTITDDGRTALNPPPRLVKQGDPLMRGRTSVRVMQGGVWVEQHQPEPSKVPDSVVRNLQATRDSKQRWARDRARREAHYAQMTIGDRLELALERNREIRSKEVARRLQRAERLLTESERIQDSLEEARAA